MRCKACNAPISIRDNKKSKTLEDLCMACRRASRIPQDYQFDEERETHDLSLMLFGDKKRRTEE